MKTVTIGDIHGSTLWKNLDPKEFDKMIFLGDYTDHWTYTDAHILNNLKDIIVLKEIYPSKVVTLLGNHDMHYMFHNRLHSCSGWRPSMDVTLRELFTEKKDLFDLAYYVLTEDGKHILWTHAGVSENWYTSRFLNVIDIMGTDGVNLGMQLNEAFKAYRKEVFDCGYTRYGNVPHGGPIWADRTEVQPWPLPNLHQIIGHTKLDEIKTFTDSDNNTSLTFVDVLEGDNPEFYYLTI